MSQRLILASASPRRRQLLEMLGLEVVVRPAGILETRKPGEAPVAYAERLAREKALAVPGGLVLGADTIVLLGKDLLEKPADTGDASRRGVDVGLHCGCDSAWWSVTHVNHPG